ncbi:chemotaxis protein CheW [Lutispora sp.]|uniref:chemotaxis protein CheW n=1 Tax=Lutispora sp. TaxID=2828727 RepID=UPI003569A172
MKTPDLLLFKLCDEVFGINVSDVKDIKVFEKITKIPDSSEYVEGIIAARGDITVVINLKMLLDLEDSTVFNDSRIIIVNSEKIQLGLLVDEVVGNLVSGVNRYEQYSNINPEVNKNYIIEIRKHKGKHIMVLDLDSIERAIKI